jgi:ribosomal protein S12 methylthiotransferase accessory factor
MKSSQFTSLIERVMDSGLVGKRFKIPQFNDEPHFFQWACENPLTNDSDDCGISTDILEYRARFKSIAESIERFFLSNPLEEQEIRGSYNSLKKKCLNPSELSLSHGTDKEGVLDNEIFSWVPGRRVSDGQEVLIPRQLVYTLPIVNERVFTIPISTGTAFGEDRESTLERSAREVVERDCFMRGWLGKSFDVSRPLKKTEELREYFERYYLQTRLFTLPNSYGPNPSLAFLIDKSGEGPAVSCGLGYGGNKLESERKALLEAQQVRSWMRLLKARGQYFPVSSPKEVVDFKSRGFFWYPLSKISTIEEFLQCAAVEPKSRVPPSKGDTGNLVNNLLNNGFEIYEVDLVPENFKHKGFQVIKTIIPGLLPLKINENFPYSPKGMQNKYQLNSLPHPFL